MRNDIHGPYPVPTAATVIPDFSTGGQFGGMCVEVTGNVTTGNLGISGTLLEGSSVLRVQNVATGAEAASITAAGLYWVSIPAIQNIKCAPSGDFVGTGVAVYFSLTECIPPAPVAA